MCRERGFTLIELMVTISVLAILLTVGVPSFTRMIEQNRRTTIVNDLVTDIHVARTEALGRNQPVVLCRGNGSSAAPGCTAGGEWTQGWVAFVDANDNGSFDSGSDTLVGIRTDLPANINLYSSLNSMTFRRFSGPRTSFKVCIDNDAARLRGIIIDRGRPRIGTTESDGSPLACS